MTNMKFKKICFKYYINNIFVIALWVFNVCEGMHLVSNKNEDVFGLIGSMHFQVRDIIFRS